MADDPKTAMFDIAIGTCGADSRVTINGEDISRTIRGCEISCVGGELTKITLLVLGFNARVTLQAAIDKEHIELKPFVPGSAD